MRLPLLASIAAIVLSVIVAIVVTLSATIGSMNCGGNSAALSDVKQYALQVTVGYENSQQSRPFRITNVTDDDMRKELARLSRDHWIRDAHLLVSTKAIDRNVRPPVLIIVCDTPYENVPQRYYFKNSPTHAAGYSDGNAKLISTKEFAQIDKSKFVPLDKLFPADPKQALRKLNRLTHGF